MYLVIQTVCEEDRKPLFHSFIFRNVHAAGESEKADLLLVKQCAEFDVFYPGSDFTLLLRKP